MADYINGVNIGDAPGTYPAPSPLIDGDTYIFGTVDWWYWDDWDRYAFVAPTSGTVRIDLYGLGDYVDLGLENEFGNFIYAVSNPGTDWLWIEATLVAGKTYYIDVVPQNFAASYYNLYIDFAEARLLNGTAGNDTLTGNAQYENLRGRAGNDTLNGAGGVDTAIYAGKASEFRFGVATGALIVKDLVTGNGNEGQDRLTAIEVLEFADRDYRLESTASGLQLTGSADDDTIDVAGGGILAVDGGGGRDIAVFRGNATDYAFTLSDGVVTVIDMNTADGNDGTRKLTSMETLRFADQDLLVTGGEFRINTTTVSDQLLPAIAPLENGDYVVTWSSATGAGGQYGVYAQRYSASGVRLGDELQMNTDDTVFQGPAAVAALGNGGFVAAWPIIDLNAGVSDILVRRYDANGNPLGQDYKVNAPTNGNEFTAAVAGLPNGGFVVAWTSSETDGVGYEVRSRRFDASGNAVGTEIRVNTTLAGTQFAPSVAVMDNGSYVIAWLSIDGSAVPSTYFQRFDAQGARLGVNTRVNVNSDAITLDYPTFDPSSLPDLLLVSTQLGPEVAILADGGFVIGATWLDWFVRADFGTSVHTYNGNGSVRTEGWLATDFHGLNTSMTVLESGDIVVAWPVPVEDGSLDMYSRRFSPDGVPLGFARQVNTTTTQDQGLGAVQALNGGGYVIAWTSTGQDLDEGGVYGQQYEEDGETVRVAVRGTDGDDVLFYIGDDAMRAFGFAGDDVYLVERADDQTIEAAGQGDDTIKSRISWTLGANVENLLLLSTASDSATGNELANRLTGNTADNILDGAQGVDTMSGGSGNDTYLVDNVGDLIVEEGPSLASLAVRSAPRGPGPQAGGTNIDTVISQVSYTLRANIENLELAGNANLTGTGNELDNLLSGNGGANTLRGLDGIDILDGGAGADTLIGGTGKDTLGGGEGNDTYVVDAGDRVVELSQQGTDTVQSTVAWTLATHLEKLVLTGGAHINGTGNGAANTLSGNGANNLLAGGGGNDVLLGGGGADTLSGGTGKDTLTGGAGADAFLFDAALAGNLDTITDFLHLSDKLHLDDDVFTTLTGGVALLAAQLRVGAAVVGAGTADHRLIYNTTTGALYYDPDGTGDAAALKFAVLGTTLHPTLTVADFTIVG